MKQYKSTSVMPYLMDNLQMEGPSDSPNGDSPSDSPKGDSPSDRF